MDIVQAWQHIYGNVEKDKSPRSVGGFQTLFYTISGLAENEIEEMEARLLYFRSHIEPVKRIFFKTSTGKIVISQITPLADPDQSGRMGRYIAHSLIFTIDSFEAIGANPFCIFQNFDFVSSIESAFQRGDFQTRNIPAINIEISQYSDQESKESANWPLEEYEKLALLALKAKQMAGNHISVSFIGEPEYVEKALKAIFPVVPISLRQNCTFDTYFYRCNPVSIYYLGIGMLERPGKPGSTVVDIQQHIVLLPSLLNPENIYERWVIKTLNSGELQNIAPYKEQVYALGEWLYENNYNVDALDSASKEIIETIFFYEPDAVRKKISRQLKKILPMSLAERILEYVHRYKDTYALYNELRNGFEMSYLLNALYSVYDDGKCQPPSSNEIQSLGNLLKNNHHVGLSFLHACWMNQYNQIRDILKKLDEVQYRNYVEKAIKFRLVKSTELLIPDRGKIFLDLYFSLREPNQINWVSLVQSILEIDDIEQLSKLAPYVDKWSPNDLHSVEKLLVGVEIPETFQKTFNQCLNMIPKEREKKGKKGFLRLFSKS